MVVCVFVGVLKLVAKSQVAPASTFNWNGIKATKTCLRARRRLLILWRLIFQSSNLQWVRIKRRRDDCSAREEVEVVDLSGLRGDLAHAVG